MRLVPLVAPGPPIGGFRTEPASQACRTLAHLTARLLWGRQAAGPAWWHRPTPRATPLAFFSQTFLPSPSRQHCSAAGSAPQSQTFFALTKAAPANTHQFQEPAYACETPPSGRLFSPPDPPRTQCSAHCSGVVASGQLRPGSTGAGPGLCPLGGLVGDGASMGLLGARH